MVLAAAFVGVALASTDNVSTVKMKVSPSKLSKKNFKPAALNVETTTQVNGDPNSAKHPTLFPDPTNRVILKFDDDIKFNTNARGLKGRCTQAKLEGATTASAAKSVCNGDLVGNGSGVGCANDGSGNCVPGIGDPMKPTDTAIPVDVLAFNGKPKNGHKIFLLWTNNPVAGILILPAVLKSGGSGDFGSTLNVTVPPVGGGSGALTEFKVHVKYKNYISARCHDRSHKLNVKAKFTYNTNPPADGGGPDNVSNFSKCST